MGGGYRGVVVTAEWCSRGKGGGGSKLDRRKALVDRNPKCILIRPVRLSGRALNKRNKSGIFESDLDSDLTYGLRHDFNGWPGGL